MIFMTSSTLHDCHKLSVYTYSGPITNTLMGVSMYLDFGYEFRLKRNNVIIGNELQYTLLFT